MSKQKRNIIAVILCLITLAVAVGIFFTTNKDSPPKDNESEIVYLIPFSSIDFIF